VLHPLSAFGVAPLGNCRFACRGNTETSLQSLCLDLQYLPVMPVRIRAFWHFSEHRAAKELASFCHRFHEQQWAPNVRAAGVARQWTIVFAAVFRDSLDQAERSFQWLAK
jgi:hypothetical protein